VLPLTASELTSSDASDACDRLDVAAVHTGTLLPVWSPTPPIAGVLRTARLVPGNAGSSFDDLRALLAGAGPVVWLLDLEGRVDYQCFGGRLAAAAREAGVPGVLVNGAVRVVDELRAMRFAVFARGVFPGAMRGRLQLGAVDDAVAIGDVTVLSGSYVVADSSGLVAFDPARADDVLRAAGESG
jgi:regulator of RNase E activity RraA